MSNLKSVCTLNREFLPDSEGWVHLAEMGEYNGFIVRFENGQKKLEPVRQVVDESALNRIMRGWQQASAQDGFHGLLVDKEHFSHDVNQSSEAMGWIQNMERRGNGIWGQVEWTDIGRELVSNKRYKTLSPVYDIERISGNRVRITGISDAGLTNTPMIKSLVPIANRDRNQGEVRMEQILQLLKLPAGADEDQVVQKLQQVLNRAGKVDALTERAETAEKERDEIKTERDKLNDQILNREADEFVEKHKDKISDPEKMKGLYVKNREAAEEMIALVKDAPARQQKTLNRKDGQAPEGSPGKEKSPEDLLSRREEQIDFVEHIKNRKGLASMNEAWTVAARLKPELFKNEVEDGS